MLGQQKASRLEFSEDQLETLMDSLPFSVGYVDREQRLVTANRVTEEWFRETRYEMRGREISEILGTVRYGLVRPHVEAVLSGEPATFQVDFELADGRVIDAQSTYTPDFGPDQEVRGFFFMGVDVSSRRRVEEELLRSQQVLEVLTREQQRISQDLHDTVGQELTALSFMSKKLARNLEARGIGDSKSAKTIAEGIKRTIGKLRKAIRGVAPVEVDTKGLMVALEHLALQTRERYSIDCHFECVRPVEVPDRNTATHLFRIAQEALNNAVKHGEARRIVLKLEADGSELRLSVQNDGMAIADDADEEASGIGVRIMHFRAGVIGARLTIQPLEDAGTIVLCTLPREGSEP